jgi:hypothetical protein
MSVHESRIARTMLAHGIKVESHRGPYDDYNEVKKMKCIMIRMSTNRNDVHV